MDKSNGLSSFIGQERIKAGLATRIEKARSQDSQLPHLIFAAPSQMGKATLSRLVADELEAPHQTFTIDASQNYSVRDLNGLVSNIHKREFVLLENIESVPNRWLDSLVKALGKFLVTIKIGTGAGAIDHECQIHPFTLVGLTTKLSRVDPMLRRWFVLYEFDSYSVQEIALLLMRLACVQKISISGEAALALAGHCGGSPGGAEVMVERIKRECWLPIIELDDVATVQAELGYGADYPQSLGLLDSLNSMDGRDFEHWAAALFRRQGYIVSLTEVTGDHGIDLMLAKDNSTSAVQCKRWSDPVGEPILRDFYGAMVSAGISRGIVMTTSTFTASAKEFAQSKPIRLIDIDELLTIGSR